MARSTNEHELGVIGAGNMAEAMLRGAMAAGFIRPQQVIASDALPQRRAAVSASLGIRCVEDNCQAARARRVLLAVKPQVIGEVLAEIAPCIAADATVLSIAAGTPTARLDAALGGRGRIVRAMPNTPMLVGCGMSAICRGPRAGDQDVDWAVRLCAASGRAVVVEESMMDAVTAVSGSGPAYFFYLAEAMIRAGVAEGLPAEVAAELAAQTCLGAGKLMVESGRAPQALRAQVTSPNGTTQRAVETLDAGGAMDLLQQAVRAAAQRSRELG